MKIYDIDSFPYDTLRALPFGPPIPKGHNAGVRYPCYTCAFDIETTRIEEIEQSIMYVWQFAASVGHDIIVCIGRTWPEYVSFIERFTAGLPDLSRIVVYVHNLSFEFQFLRSWFDFNHDDAVFIVRSRKILKAVTGNIEYRCSYLHSNMSLDEYTHKMGVTYAKVHGFNYSKIRYPWTPLSSFEISYIVADVVGLIQAIEKEMSIDHDDLYSIPLTSTGYVRRELKKAMQAFPKVAIKRMQPTLPVFEMLREAFRGGDTHANRYYTGQILQGVNSVDRSSSYPDCQVNELYPMGIWDTPHKPIDDAAFWNMVRKQRRAVLVRIALKDIHLKRPDWGAPYLSRDKCRRICCLKRIKDKNGNVQTVRDEEREKFMYDNGRILYASYLETTVTDIDLRIILDEYEIGGYEIIQATTCRYARLPVEWIDQNLKYYRRKTELKGVEGQEIYYMKDKAKLNAIYGDTVQDPAKIREIYKDNNYVIDSRSIAELLAESEKYPYKSYAWGVWCTAYARRELHKVIKMAHDAVDPDTGIRFNGFVYSDTDSVKYLGEIPELEKYNRDRRKLSEHNGAYADDPAGHRHYMGVYEKETGPGGYEQFMTLGAKKYCYVEKGKLHITIAGVSKSIGPREMKNDITNFKTGFTFHDAGGLESIYNDEDYGYYTILEKATRSRYHGRPRRTIHRLYITRNLTLRPSSYTIGIAGDYYRILHNPEIYLAIFNEPYYNSI